MDEIFNTLQKHWITASYSILLTYHVLRTPMHMTEHHLINIVKYSSSQYAKTIILADRNIQ